MHRSRLVGPGLVGARACCAWIRWMGRMARCHGCRCHAASAAGSRVNHGGAGRDEQVKQVGAAGCVQENGVAKACQSTGEPCLQPRQAECSSSTTILSMS